MENYKIEFIENALRSNALQFGDKTLKSGRLSPYFFNTGSFNTAQAMVQVGKAYAGAILGHNIPCDTIFGPAYKGIPLATAAVMALAHERPGITYSCNRKEIKDHGDTGMILGAKPGKNCLIVDDVITSGASIRESIEFIRANGGEVCGALILVDRKEKGKESDLSAVQEVQEEFGIRVYSVINVDDILQYADSNEEYIEHAHKIEEYRRKYGVL